MAVERTTEASIGAYDQQEFALRRFRRAVNQGMLNIARSCYDFTYKLLNLLRIRFGGLGALHRCGELGCSNHLHRLGDALDRAYSNDSSSDFPYLGHGADSVASKGLLAKGFCRSLGNYQPVIRQGHPIGKLFIEIRMSNIVGHVDKIRLLSLDIGGSLDGLIHRHVRWMLSITQHIQDEYSKAR